MTQQYHLIFHSTLRLTLEAIAINFLTIRFIMIYENIFLSSQQEIFGIICLCPKRKHG